VGDAGQSGDHQCLAEELARDELPSKQEIEQHAELDNQVGRGDHEDDRVRPRRAARRARGPSHSRRSCTTTKSRLTACVPFGSHRIPLTAAL
jgi:hypothetical protein